MNRIVTVLFLIPILLGAMPVAAGVVFEIETTDHEASPPKVETMEAYAEGKNLKMSIGAGQSDGSKTGMIYRGDRRELVAVDHDNKTYMVMDEEMAKSIGGQVHQALSQMEEALKNVPEDQRALIEKMMKDKMPSAETTQEARSEVRKTGERAEHNGYPTVKYEVHRDGRKVQELWVTDWSHVKGGDEAADAFLGLADFFEQFLASMQGAGGSSFFPSTAGDNMFIQMKEIDGFPVITKTFGDDGSLEGESSLRSTSRRTLDPAEFEPPAGYKRRSMMPGS